MIRCETCGTESPDRSQYCDECGAKLPADVHRTDIPNVRPQTAESPVFRGANVTSVGIPPIIDEKAAQDKQPSENGKAPNRPMNAVLTIERGESTGAEFILAGSESNIGRWDADNGIFPDVDLDSHDSEAKVSRRHARISLREGKYVIEDLGSTNGTYVNRGRRLLPGQPHVLNDGDEIIVGKTFLRFHITH